MKRFPLDDEQIENKETEINVMIIPPPMPADRPGFYLWGDPLPDQADAMPESMLREQLTEAIPYQVGERVFIGEAWASTMVIAREVYYHRVGHRGQAWDWQPNDEMPIAAARFAAKIVSSRIARLPGPIKGRRIWCYQYQIQWLEVPKSGYRGTLASEGWEGGAMYGPPEKMGPPLLGKSDPLDKSRL